MQAVSLCEVFCITVHPFVSFLTTCLALALTLGLGEDLQKLYISKVSSIMILLICISIMIHFVNVSSISIVIQFWTKYQYQYHDTI